MVNQTHPKCALSEVVGVASLKFEDCSRCDGFSRAHVAKYAKLLVEQIRLSSGQAKWRALSAHFAALCGTYTKHGPPLCTRSMDPFMDLVHELTLWTTPHFVNLIRFTGKNIFRRKREVILALTWTRAR